MWLLGDPESMLDAEAIRSSIRKEFFSFMCLINKKKNSFFTNFKTLGL